MWPCLRDAGAMRTVPFVTAILAAVPCADLIGAFLTTPRIVVAGAVLPALILALLTGLLDRDHATSRAARWAAFVWGAAVATFLASRTNDLLLASMPGLVGAERARWLTPALLAPLVEETAKATGLVLLVMAGRLHDLRQGLVYGALLGLGFTMTENLGYLTIAVLQGGDAGLARSVYTRAVLAGVNHAVFTATLGAAVGWARQRGSAAIVLAGFALAVAQHALWNVLASHAISDTLCNAPRPDAPCALAPDALGLWVVIPLVVAAALGPGLAGLAVAAARARRLA